MFADDEYDPDEAEEIAQAIKKEGRIGLFFFCTVGRKIFKFQAKKP